MIAISSVWPLIIIGSLCQNTPQVEMQAQDDKKLASIMEVISKTSPEGLIIIAKAQRLRPELNEQRSAKRLGDIVDDYSLNGMCNITPIGWEAYQKKSGRWRIAFYYQDYQKRYQAAEWEYNPEINKIYAFEANNAPQFWRGKASKKKSKSQ